MKTNEYLNNQKQIFWDLSTNQSTSTKTNCCIHQNLFKSRSISSFLFFC